MLVTKDVTLIGKFEEHIICGQSTLVLKSRIADYLKQEYQWYHKNSPKILRKKEKRSKIWIHTSKRLREPVIICNSEEPVLYFNICSFGHWFHGFTEQRKVCCLKDVLSLFFT